MMWGAFFHYPGDPFGDQRITEEDRRTATAALAESVATFATKLQTNEIVGFDAVNLEEPEVIGSQLVKQFSKGAAESEPEIDDTPNEGFAENSFIEMLTETLTTAAKNSAERRNNRSIDPKTKLHSVTKAAEEAVENCLKKKMKDAGRPHTSRERVERQIKIIQHTFSVMEEAFGPGHTSELLERVGSDMVQQSLAKLGDLLTPEHYAAELRFLDLLQATIERNYNWLMKLQSERAKKAGSTITSPQPDWATRRR
jgi:hypothetical protein